MIVKISSVGSALGVYGGGAGVELYEGGDDLDALVTCALDLFQN